MKKLIPILLLVLVFAAVAKAQDVQQIMDLGGRVIRIQTQWGGDTPLGPRGAYNWYNPDERLKAHIEKVEKMFNCKIEFVLEGNRADALEALRLGILAGDQPFDFFQHSITPELIADGLIQPLNDYIGPDFYDSYPPLFQRPDPKIGAAVGDTIYTFESSNTSPGTKYILWNKSMVERAGVESLYDIYERGEWNWDKFEEVLHALTRDTDGDGITNVWGIRSTNLKDEIIVMLVSNSARVSKLTDDGKLVFDLLNPHVIETLEFMQRLYRDGVWARRGQTELDGAAMTIATGTDITSKGYQDHMAIIGDEFGLMLPPQGPNGKNEFNMYAAPGGAIPVYVKDPEVIIEVVSALWMLKEPYIEDMAAWEQAYWDRYIWGLQDEQSYKFLVNPDVNPVFLPGPIEREILFPSSTPPVFNRIIVNGESATSVLAAEQPVFQAKLDEILKQ